MLRINYNILKKEIQLRNPEEYAKDIVVEGTIIETREGIIKDINTKIRILRERLEALGTIDNPKPVPQQPIFSAEYVAPNVHT